MQAVSTSVMQTSRRPGPKARIRRRTLGLLLASGASLLSVQLGCDATMKTVKGCGADSECPMGTICRATDGRCITPPPTIQIDVVLTGDGTGTVTSTPAGITCGSTCSGKFNVGEKMTLTANPGGGSKVAGFSIGCTSQTATCDITPDGNINPLRVLVNFAVDVASVQPALCNEYGFCWENPRPIGNRLRRVIVPSGGELWAVGDAGTVLRRTNGNFTLMPTGSDRNLNGIWGSSGDNFVVGDTATVLRYQGAGYVAEAGTGGNLLDVFGGLGTTFAVGSGGTIARRTGTGTWMADTSGTTQDLWGIWGSSLATLTAVGGAGMVSRYSGTGTVWTSAPEAAFASYTFRGLTGVGTTLWAIDSFGGIARYAGTWTETRRNNNDNLFGVAIVAGTPYVAGGNPGGTGTVLRYDGTTWQRDVSGSGAPNTFYGIAGSAANDVWAVGEAGTVWQYDGTSWQPKSSGLTTTLNGIAAVDTQNVWAVGSGGTLLRYNGTYFTPQNIGATGSLQAVWAASSSDVWAVGSGGQAWHFTGTTWTATDSKTTANLNGVFGLGPNQVWAVGDGGIIRFWDGSSWAVVSSGSASTLRRVWAASASEIWAVGDAGIAQRSSGGAFTPVVLPGGVMPNLYDVWGNAGAVWVVADNAVFRYAGGSFSTLAAPGTGGLRAISGTGPSDLWATGLGGVLMRFNGTTWTRDKTGAGTDLLSIQIVGTRAWLVGSNGTVLRKTL